MFSPINFHLRDASPGHIARSDRVNSAGPVPVRPKESSFSSSLAASSIKIYQLLEPVQRLPRAHLLCSTSMYAETSTYAGISG
jgi:hypothetical protein